MQRDTERLPQCKLIVFSSDTIPSECILKILVSSFDFVYQDSWSLSLSLPASPFFSSTTQLTFYLPFFPWVGLHGGMGWKRNWKRKCSSISCHLSSLGNI